MNRSVAARQMPRQTGKRGAPSPNATKGVSGGYRRAESVAAVEGPAVVATTLTAPPIRSTESVGALACVSYFVRPFGKWIAAIVAIATAVVRNRQNFEHAAAGAARPSRHAKRGCSTKTKKANTMLHQGQEPWCSIESLASRLK
eukprot:GHVS01052115.1.p1 GENE.GHVS01052115.1~~GHVS01052115.1.p1  ORF type:complete len:144 (-),score=12.85 GHVS01052115.1:335-766(-)